MKNQYIGGGLPKKGGYLKGGGTLDKKEGVVFLRGMIL